MFPSHMSVNDLGVFAVVMVFGWLIVLLFIFDFVSMTSFRRLCWTARVELFISLILTITRLPPRTFLLRCKDCLKISVYTWGEFNYYLLYMNSKILIHTP